MRVGFRYGCLVGVTILAVSCGDNSLSTSGSGGPLIPTPKPVQQHVEGVAWSLADSMPLAGATAALVKGVPYEVVAGPVTTDAEGHFEFQDPPIGDCYLFLFTGDHLMQDGRAVQISIGEGDSISVDAAMIPSELWSNRGPRAEGIVTDRQTGSPIAGAFVSSLGWELSGPFMGVALSGEGVSDSTGHYSVALATISYGDYSRLGHQLGVSKEGYAPFFTTDFGELDDDSVVTLNIPLSRPSVNGAIHGRVVVGGQPVAGVPVGIDFVDLSSLPSPANAKTLSENPEFVPLLGKSTMSGPDGRFEITGLAEGSYTVQCAYLPDDGYAYQERYQYPELSRGEVLDLGDMEVVPAIEPLYPVPSSTISDPQPVLRWKEQPEADYYRVSSSVGHLMNSYTVITTQWQIPVALPPGTRIRWYVRAYREAEPWDIELSSFDTVVAFKVSD